MKMTTVGTVNARTCQNLEPQKLVSALAGWGADRRLCADTYTESGRGAAAGTHLAWPQPGGSVCTASPRLSLKLGRLESAGVSGGAGAVKGA